MLTGWFVVIRMMKQIVEITPSYVRIQKECFARNLGQRQLLLRAEIQPEDVVWYFQEMAGQSDVPVLGFNYRNRTIEIAYPKSYRNEIAQLAEEIRNILGSPFRESEIPGQIEIQQHPSIDSYVNSENLQFQANISVATGIERSEDTAGLVQFRIPGNMNQSIRLSLGGPLFLLFFGGMLVLLPLMGDSSGDHQNLFPWLKPALICFLIGSVWGTKLLQNIVGITILTLSPEWIQVRYELFGSGFSRRVATKRVKAAKVSCWGHVRAGSTRAMIEGITLTVKTTYPFVIGLRGFVEGLYNIAPIRFGSHLERDEQEWLVQEINAYLEKFKDTINHE
jgi:hypothetical protein